jgi:hypothetical protein
MKRKEEKKFEVWEDDRFLLMDLSSSHQIPQKKEG